MTKCFTKLPTFIFLLKFDEILETVRIGVGFLSLKMVKNRLFRISLEFFNQKRTKKTIDGKRE